MRKSKNDGIKKKISFYKLFKTKQIVKKEQGSNFKKKYIEELC
jgi:hypothetical protein